LDIRGRHLLVDLWLDQELTDHVVEKLTGVIEEELTVVQKNKFHFEPYGLTIAYILAESHFTAHTYPEHQFISMDIYICAPEINLEAILDRMVAGIKIKKIQTKSLDRGLLLK